MNRNEKKKLSLFKKMLMQLAICAVIYIIFYLIKNTNYIFSEDVINKTKELLSYDINWGNLQSGVGSFIENNKDNLGFLGFFGNDETTQDGTNTAVENNEANTIENNAVNETDENVVNNSGENNEATNIIDINVVGGIGGAETNEIIEENADTKEKSQSEIDIEYIKANYNFIVPVTGTVTSRYGTREATEVVSANHQGTDIGANEGTPIYAAMDGTVEVASEEGEYGKHIDITNGDVLTRYAHCSKLLVKEGQEVKQGDKIAEVGSTGNSTGPHLHFEIRRDNRVINPESIIEF